MGPFGFAQGRLRGSQGTAKSFHEHAVSVGIEAIAFGDCVFIGCQDVLASAEGAYQHQQSGLRQVEVRKHRFDYFKFET